MAEENGEKKGTGLLDRVRQDVTDLKEVIKEKGKVFQYHPQTEALLQWFEIGNPSNAIGGAYSYPDTAALTQTATQCPF